MRERYNGTLEERIEKAIKANTYGVTKTERTEEATLWLAKIKQTFALNKDNTLLDVLGFGLACYKLYILDEELENTELETEIERLTKEYINKL